MSISFDALPETLKSVRTRPLFVLRLDVKPHGPDEDADLDRANEGKMAKFAPNLGALFQLVANHSLMHAGQFTVVRRALNKPVLF